MKKVTIEKTRDTSCPMGKDVLDAPPPEIAAALKVFSGKWTLMILCQLSKRVARFNELKRTVASVKVV